MSSELERLQQSGRRINLFWLIVTTCMTAFCLFGAFSDQPTMLHDWRGAALLLLSSVFVFRYAWWYWTAFHKQREPLGRGSIPWQSALRRWSIIFGNIALMTALHPMMGWLFWTTFGMAFSIFRMPLLPFPVGVCVLGLFYTLFAISQPPIEAIPWIIISMGLGMLSSGYMAYLQGRLMRERIEREHVFSSLEDAHRQLGEAHRQLELSAEREAEFAVFAERARLAREMHDTIGHALVLAAVKLEAAQRLRAVNPERADHEIEVTKEVVRSTMSEMRATLANLRAPINEQAPLGEALARRAREAGERAGFHVTYQLAPDLCELPAQAREALFRIGTEALTNIEKHARAREVSISLAQQGDVISLRIEDNGIGLLTPVAAGKRTGKLEANQLSSQPGHYGITGMRERAEALGGHLALTSHPGKGTIVEACIPHAQEQT